MWLKGFCPHTDGGVGDIVEIGKLRHRITLQEYKVVGYDPANQPILDWGEVATVWASVQPISGREYWARSQIQAEVTHRIRIRYIAGIKPTMRIQFRDRTFEIESIINWHERNIDLQLMCKEKVS